MNKKYVIALLVIYLGAAVAAVILFEPDRFGSQMAGWIGGLTFGLIVKVVVDYLKNSRS